MDITDRSTLDNSIESRGRHRWTCSPWRWRCSTALPGHGTRSTHVFFFFGEWATAGSVPPHGTGHQRSAATAVGSWHRQATTKALPGPAPAHCREIQRGRGGGGDVRSKGYPLDPLVRMVLIHCSSAMSWIALGGPI
jgi:hypothetical protein